MSPHFPMFAYPCLFLLNPKTSSTNFFFLTTKLCKVNVRAWWLLDLKSLWFQTEHASVVIPKLQIHFDPLLLQGVAIPIFETWHKSLQFLTLNGWHKSLEQWFLDLKEDASIKQHWCIWNEVAMECIWPPPN